MQIGNVNFFISCVRADRKKPPNVGFAGEMAIYGSLPPKRESFEDICGPPSICPDCPDPRDFKCKDISVTLYDLLSNLEIKPTENINYPGLPNRTFGKQWQWFFITTKNMKKLSLLRLCPVCCWQTGLQ